jgi:hypothetical protein
VLEPAPFRERSDQAEVPEVPASKDRFRKQLIQRVAVRHDEEARAGFCGCHLRHRHVACLDPDVGRHFGGKLPVPLVDPGDTAIEACEHPHQCLSDVSGAEENDVERRRAQGLEKERPSVAQAQHLRRSA